MPKVYNRRATGVPADAVYVGRPTIFGNPFKVGVHGDREKVIEMFRTFVRGTVELKRAIKEQLAGKNLVCWCAPKNCHADVLLEMANEVCWLCGSIEHEECEGDGWLYFVHEESGAIWRQKHDLREDETDGLVEPCSKKRYHELKAQGYGENNEAQS